MYNCNCCCCCCMLVVDFLSMGFVVCQVRSSCSIKSAVAIPHWTQTENFEIVWYILSFDIVHKGYMDVSFTQQIPEVTHSSRWKIAGDTKKRYSIILFNQFKLQWPSINSSMHFILIPSFVDGYIFFSLSLNWTLWRWQYENDDGRSSHVSLSFLFCIFMCYLMQEPALFSKVSILNKGK